MFRLYGQTLISIKPTISISGIVQKIKVSSSRFIHTHFRNPHFAWQDGYGVFSCSPQSKEIVCKYILNQREHHREKLFQDEYIFMLNRAEIQYNVDFIFR